MKQKAIAFLLAIMLFVVTFTACSVVTGNYETTDGDVKVTFVEPSYKVEQRQTDIPTRSSFLIEMCKNETEGCVFVLRNDESEIKNASISVSDLKTESGDVISADRISLYREKYIHISGYTGGEKDCPDALIPMQYDDLNSFTAKKGENLPYFVDVKTLKTDVPGLYTGTATVTFDSGIVNVPLSVRVYDIAIPDEPMMGTVMAGPWDSRILYGSLNGAQMLYDELSDIRMSLTSMPDVDGRTPELFVETIAKYAANPRITVFYCPNYVETVDADGTVHLNEDLMTRLVKALRENDLMDKAYWSLTDEPTKDYDVRMTRTFTEELHKIAPEAHVCSAMNRFLSNLLPDGIETWNLSWQATSDSAIAQIKASGGQVFRYGTEEFYIAGNNLIEGKTRFWTQLRQGIVGYMQWAADNYRIYDTEAKPEPVYLLDEKGNFRQRDYWNDPYVFIPVENYPTYSAGGDSYLFYPGFENDGIVNRDMLVRTVRLLGLRDGIEDYSLLSIRRAQIEKRLEEYGSDLSPDLFMAIYYDSVNNIIDKNAGTEVSEFDKYSHQRSKLLADIIADSYVLVSIARPEDSFVFDKRVVTVLAPEGETVLINGKEAGTATVDTKDATTVITVAVGEKEYSYTVYPKIIKNTDVFTDFSDTESILSLNKKLSASDVSYSDGDLTVQLPSNVKTVSLPSAAFIFTNIADHGNTFAVDVTNNTDEDFTELDISFSSMPDRGYITTDDIISAGERKVVYFDFGNMNIRPEDVSRIVLTFANGANVTIHSLSAVTIK